MLDLMSQINLQNFLFSKDTSRIEYNRYKPLLKSSYRVQVFRNHSFEFVEHTIHAFLDYAETPIEFLYSGYDDSFSFQGFDDKADLYIIWIDGTKYSGREIGKSINERLKFLRKLSERPILLIPYECNICTDVIDVTTFNLEAIKDRLKEDYKDIRAKKITGTELSRTSLMLISRELGLKYLPALLKPAIKAIITDFDNTLYSGVLGEDGIEGIKLTDGHKDLQMLLKKYSDEGVFLCAVSKNEQEDVEKLLENRKDFLLSSKDFTKITASWNSKTDSIRELAKYMNIGMDSIVYIDDNIGELIAVSAAIPSIHVVLAKENPKETVAALREYPCLCKHMNNILIDRKADTKANEERRKILLENSKEDYIKKLGIIRTFCVNNKTQVQRISELSNKTNQFIFSYKRYSIAQVEEIMENPNKCVVSVSLKDKLSDSGLICAIVGIDTGEYLRIEEVFMSCRALGRNIEDIIVLQAIAEITKVLKKKKIFIDFSDGERNKPARQFCDKYLATFIAGPSDFEYSVPYGLVKMEIK